MAKQKEVVAQGPILTYRSTEHFSSWVRHVVLFNIHQFQLFESLYMYKIAYLTLYISLFLKLLNKSN